MCERAGGGRKVLWKASTTEKDIETDLEVTAAAAMITWAKNQRINESGFSPAQLVLGRSQTLPRGLLSERGHSQIAAHEAVDNDPYMKKRLQVYSAAKVALEKLDTSKRLRRAWVARSRQMPPSTNVKPGD
eukprot:2132460-Pyramimonas_sp.AAC.1